MRYKFAIFFEKSSIEEMVSEKEIASYLDMLDNSIKACIVIDYQKMPSKRWLYVKHIKKEIDYELINKIKEEISYHI